MSTGSKFERAVQIMHRLRAPGGCPWDREQTFDSIKPFTLEETYEVLEAMRGVQWYGFPYWDAVVWATAKLNLVPYLLSENGNDGAVLAGVHYLNPFNPRFDRALLTR